jgi:hypothetical protein
MSLHHVVHLVLVAASLVANVMAIGTLIAFLHDFSDIPFMLAKTLNLMGYGKPWAFVVFGYAQVGWIYFRLFCFPILIWEYGLIEYAPERSELRPFTPISQIFLCTLFMLHTFWFCLFLKIDYYALFKNEYKDRQNDY